MPISRWISVSDRLAIMAPLLTLARQAATYQAGMPTHSCQSKWEERLSKYLRSSEGNQSLTHGSHLALVEFPCNCWFLDEQMLPFNPLLTGGI